MKIKAAAIMILLSTLGTICILALPSQDRSKFTVPSESSKKHPPTASLADGLSLTNDIKEVESPVFRAYLYARVAKWLSQSAGDDANLQRAAMDASARGISDIHEHEREIPPGPAFDAYNELLSVVRKYDAEEAGKLERDYPLRLTANASEGDKAVRDFHTVLTQLGDPNTADQNTQKAVRLVGSGNVSIVALHGELLHLDQINSPALPQLLDATLTLEERNKGAIPLRNMFFLSYLYLKSGVPAGLQARFLAAAVNATRLSMEELRNAPEDISWSTQLLQACIPYLQKSNPPLYAEAAARLAGLMSGNTTEAGISDRIRDSEDPLAAAVNEADSTRDEQLKKTLLEYAARLARQKGDLRRAVDLIVSADGDAHEQPGSYSARDSFLEKVLQDALAKKDVETARYALSKMEALLYRAAALQRLARYFIQAKDNQSAAEVLGDAVTSLKDAPDNADKAAMYLRLATDFSKLDLARELEAVNAAIKSVNKIPPPAKEAEGEFNWHLLPLADALTTTFQGLALENRIAADAAAHDLKPKQLRIAAMLGVYSAQPK
jgi:hypothetical protein